MCVSHREGERPLLSYFFPEKDSDSQDKLENSPIICGIDRLV